MYRIKFLTLVALAAILMGGLFASASAQTSITPIDEQPVPDGQPLSGVYTTGVQANELSAGELDYVTGNTYGVTFYGDTKGDLSGFVFISVNYTAPEALPSKSAGQSKVAPPTSSKVISGSWSKLIFVDGQYVGSVYGKIIGGTLVWNKAEGINRLSLELSADDGTGSYAGSLGRGGFEGTWDQSGNTKVPTVAGTLTLKY